MFFLQSSLKTGELPYSVSFKENAFKKLQHAV
jgi:hypothetical protein